MVETVEKIGGANTEKLVDGAGVGGRRTALLIEIGDDRFDGLVEIVAPPNHG